MERIRPFESRDIPQVANLHQRVFELPSALHIGERYRKYFERQFLEPARQGGLSSLVFESATGDILGFIAVATRRFLMRGNPVRVALSSQFIVDPQARSKLVGVALLRAFLDGPQDLSFTDEANDTSRKLWEKLGGSAEPIYSTHWIAPLRPIEFWSAKNECRLGCLVGAITPIARVVDRFISRTLLVTPQVDSNVRIEALTPRLLMELMSHAVMDDVLLRPVYDPECIQSLLDDSNQPLCNGRVQQRLVRTVGGQVAGWFVYCVGRRGIAEVLQLGGRESHRSLVINALFAHARQNSVTALSGRLEPHIVRAISDQRCFLSRRQHTMLVHSRDAQLLNTIHLGKAFISRLEGEWSLRFH